MVLDLGADLFRLHIQVEGLLKTGVLDLANFFGFGCYCLRQSVDLLFVHFYLFPKRLNFVVLSANTSVAFGKTAV